MNDWICKGPNGSEEPGRHFPDPPGWRSRQGTTADVDVTDPARRVVDGGTVYVVDDEMLKAVDAGSFS